MITYGSICTGYDGIGRGLAMADVETSAVWHADVEPAMRDLLARESPAVPNLGDIKTAPWSQVPHVSVMSSGDPCQSISVAGRQAGREDPRFLWPWVRGAYRAVRPDVIFFENVANIVSHDGGRTLAERYEHLTADGYGVRWTVLGACAVGAPHHRHRWYAVASRVFTGVERIGAKAFCGAPRSGGRILLPTPRATDVGTAGRRSSDGWRPQLGQAVLAIPLLPTLKASDGSNGGPNQRDGAGNYYLPGIAVRPEAWGRYAEAIALWEQVTGIPAPAPTVTGPKGGARLNPALPEWMMGLSPGLLTEHMTRGEALKAAGNGVVPHAAAAAWRMLTDGMEWG